jgi:hypothetical protein
MFGYSRNSGISWFRDYGDALHKYEATTDIRGRTEEPKRPLGQRKSVDMYSIVKRDDGAIQCVLYKTPVVTFFPDNTVEITDGMWTTQSTACFIDDVMGYGVLSRVFNGHICIEIGSKEYRLEKDTPFKLVKDEQGYWEAVGVPTFKVHHINRAGSNNVMKRYKEFNDYVANVIKLRMTEQGVSFSPTEYKEAFGAVDSDTANMLADLSRSHYADFVPTMRKFKHLINDTNEDTKHLSYYHALLLVARSKGYVQWTGNEHGKVELRPYQIKELPNFVRNLLWGIHRDECFKEVDIDEGVVKRDAYLRFYQAGWAKFHEKT